MKRLSYLILIFLLSVTFSSCGGGGSGIDLPPITQSDKIELRADSFIAQTNGSITLEATVSSKGRSVPGVEVMFTNLSPIGNFCNGIKEAITDSSGKAKVCIKSTTPGFAIIQAEVNKGVGIVRDRKSIFFTTAFVIYPTLKASIDGDGDGVFDESDDFVMISNGRDTATLKARLIDATGTPIAGRTIGFSTDTTYIDCTIEDCTSLNQPYKQEVVFPNGRYAWTNYYGEATIEIIASSNIKEFRTSFNVAAWDTTSGASDMFTIFLDPITVGTVTVVAQPQVVAPSETSEVTTCAYTTEGIPVPDGTIIQLSATAGIIAPFVQTTNGCATTTYTAPSTEGTYTITATAGGVIGITSILVTTELTVQPDDMIVNGAAPADIIPFTIYGGLAPYTVTSSNLAITLSAIAADGTFTATVPAGTAAGSVTLTVRDSIGTTATATITITAIALSVQPPSATVAPLGSAGYTIIGGTGPYTVVTSHPAITTISAVTPTATGGTFTVSNTFVCGADTTVTITVIDNVGTTKTADYKIDCP